MDLKQQTVLGEEEAPLPPKKKGVQFHSRGSVEQVRRISRYSMYDPEEIVAYWGESNEHTLRKEELKTAVREWQSGRRGSDNFSFTTCGIADKVGEGRLVKKENRAKSRNAVMDEQYMQETEGIMDDKLMADIYAVTTSDAKKKAQNEALKISDEVKAFHGDS
jgi:hypothetical protein